jgi:hypothetical protein
MDNRGHFACPLGDRFGLFVHVGWIHSRSPGLRGRGGADQSHSGPKGRVTTSNDFTGGYTTKKGKKEPNRRCFPQDVKQQ